MEEVGSALLPGEADPSAVAGITQSWERGWDQGSWGSAVLSCWQLSPLIREEAEKTQGLSHAGGAGFWSTSNAEWSPPGREVCPYI